MSYISQPMQDQSLNGIISISDGSGLIIENGTIENISNISAQSATITNLNTSTIYTDNFSTNSTYSKTSTGYSSAQAYINTTLIQANEANIKKVTANAASILGLTTDSINTGIITSGSAYIDDMTINNTFNLIPAGTIQMTVVNTTNAPSGWLYCRGQAINRFVYNRLFLAIGTTFGTGDGSTTFNLPNFQGAFLRGLTVTDSAITGYATAAIGTYQIDQMRQHTHTMRIRNPSTVQGVQGGLLNAADNSTITGVTDTGTDNRGHALSSETVPYHSIVNYLIKY